MSDNYELDFGSDDRKDWSDDDDGKKNDASHDDQTSNQIADTNHNPLTNTIMDTSKRVSHVPVIPSR